MKTIEIMIRLLLLIDCEQCENNQVRLLKINIVEN